MKYILTLILTIFAFNANAEEFGDLETRGWGVERLSNGAVEVCGVVYKNGADEEYCATHSFGSIGSNGQIGETLQINSTLAKQALEQKTIAPPANMVNPTIYLYGTKESTTGYADSIKTYLHSNAVIMTDNGDPSEDHTASIGVFKINYSDYVNNPNFVAWSDAIRTIERSDYDTTSTFHEAVIAGYYLKTKFPNLHDASSGIRAAILGNLNPDKSINLANAMSYQPPASD